MKLKRMLTECMERSVLNGEEAGLTLLIRSGKREIYLQEGFADTESGKSLARDSIFRLYSQSKPVTAAAVMLLVERGQLDLLDSVDRFLPGFRNPRMIDAEGRETPLLRAPWIAELLSMTSGLCYPDVDPAGQRAARVFEEEHRRIEAGCGSDTVTFCDLLGREPLAFAPGAHWRYGTSADVLGAVVEVVSGKRFGQFLQEELLDPLEMKDTGFWVPEEKRDRLVTCYKRTEEGLKPFSSLHLAVGKYDAPPAFESGGAGLVSTLDDYMHFARMLMAGGEWEGKRILSEASVRMMTAGQLSPVQRADMWDNLNGFTYGWLMRICAETGRTPHLSSPGEYGWDGWLGTYFANLPAEDTTVLMFQNTTDAGTTPVVRKCRNLLAAD